MTSRTLAFLYFGRTRVQVADVFREHDSSSYYTTVPARPRMMPFEDYRKLRTRLKLRSRLAGIPVAVVGVSLSSAVNIHFHPQMLEFQHAEVEMTPIL